MKKIMAVFEMTVKKVKEPAFSLLFVVAAVIGACVSEMESLSLSSQDNSLLFGLVSLEQGQPLLAGFVIILFMTLIVAIFSGATDIPKDIQSRMIVMVLAKPVTRMEYLIGKYLGVVAICISFFIIAALSAGVAHYVKTQEMFPWTVFARQFLLLLAVFPVAAIATMISTFFGDISAMIVTGFYLFTSLIISAIAVFVDMLPRSLGLGAPLNIAAYFFPNFFFYFNSFKCPGIVMAALVAYSFAVSVIFLIIAAVRMQRRDMI